MKFLSEFLNSGTVTQQNKRRLGAILIAITAALLAVTLIVLMIASIVTAIKNKQSPVDEPNEDGNGIPNGYVTTTFAEGQSSMGTLLLLDESHPYVGAETFVEVNRDQRPLADDGDPVYSVKFEFCNNQVTQETMDAFNAMMKDFYASEKDGWLYLSKAANGTFLTLEYVPEGGSSSTTLPIYDSDNQKPVEAYEWIYENASNYGFIQASDVEGKENVFRYVGVVHATYMTKNNKTLPEYLELLKTRTAAKALLVSAKNEEGKTVSYRVYYVAADAEALVPEKYEYTVSGDNMGGYIVTVDPSSAKK